MPTPKYHPTLKAGDYLRSPSGHIYSVDHAHAAQDKADNNPKSLTDVDLGLIESFFGTQSADRAAEARHRALAPATTHASPPETETATFLDEMAAYSVAMQEGEAAYWRGARERFDRETYAQQCRRDLESPVVAGLYDSVKYLVARAQYQHDPRGLTDDDIAQLAVVDPAAGDAARAARAGSAKEPEKADPADHRRPASVHVVTVIGRQIVDHFDSWVGTVQCVARECRERLNRLEQGVDSQAVAALKAQIVALEGRLDEVERRPQLRYLGTWDPHETYSAGTLVTFDNSTWYAKQPSTALRPGGSDAWQLMVRKGKDGRDARVTSSR